MKRPALVALFAIALVAVQFRPSRSCTCSGEPWPLFLVESGTVLPANARGILSPHLSVDWGRVPIVRLDKPESHVPFKVEKVAYPEPLRKGRGGSLTFSLLCPEWEPGGVYRIGAGPHTIEVTISKEAFVPATGEVDIWEDEIGPVTTGGGTTCSIHFTAHRLGVELTDPEVQKWGTALLYFTLVDERTHWHPTRSLCERGIPGRSWVGPMRDLLYSGCRGDAGAFENLPTGKHTVTMIAWLPGVGETIAKREIMLDCHEK